MPLILTVPQAQGVISSALGLLQIDYPASRRTLMLGTAIQESGLKAVRQVGGPALGLWQMESATHDSLWTNFLAYRPHFSAPINHFLNYIEPAAELLTTNHVYAAAMAALRYYDSKAVMPANDDVAACAAVWKQYYNTVNGAGTEQEFIDNYTRMVQDSAT